mgnify:CR=1 FL=1
MDSKTIKKFTNNLIKGLKLESSGYTVFCNRLELRVYKTEAWSFGYRFKSKSGRLTIGKYPYISIAEAIRLS